MNIAITGHRPNKLGNDYNLTSDLIHKIKKRIINILYGINTQDTVLITGMALGIDTLFAKIAIENNIPFIAAIPCKNHWAKWPQKSVDLYQQILQHKLCTINNISTQPYNQYCMQKRNEWMVNNCDLLIAVWDKSSGGTANCVKYAQSQNKEIIFINPNDFK